MTASKFTKTAATPKAPRTAKTRVAQDTQAAYQGSADHDAHRVFTEKVAQAQDEYLAAQNVSLGYRLLAGTVTGLCTYAGSMYLAMPMVEVISLAALALTGSGFLALMVWVIGFVLAVWSAIIAGWNVGKFVATFDMDAAMSTARDIKESSLRRVSLVRDWFRRPDGQAEHAEAHYAAQ